MLRTRSISNRRDLPVVCWGLTAPLEAQVREAAVAVEVPRTVDALRDALIRASRAALLYALPSDGEQQPPLWDAVDSARKRGARVALIAVAIVGRSSYAAVFDGARAGVGALLMAAPRFDVTELSLVIAEAAHSTTAAQIWQQLAQELGPRSDTTDTLLRRVVARAHTPVTLPLFAEACQMHERSLRKYCARHALPEPQQLISWARLLWCAHALDDGATPVMTAEQLAFPSVDAMRKLVARLLHSNLSTLRQQQLLPLACRRFAGELRGNRTAERPQLVLMD